MIGRGQRGPDAQPREQPAVPVHEPRPRHRAEQLRPEHRAPVGQLRTRHHGAPGLSAQALSGIRHVLHQHGEPRSQVRRRCRVRPSRIRRAFLPGRLLPVHDRPAVRREQLEDLPDLVHDADARPLDVRLEVGQHVRRRHVARSRPGPPEPRAAIPLRRRPPARRLLQRAAEQPALPEPRQVRDAQSRKRLPQLPAPARSHVGRHRARNGGRARGPRPVLDAEPPSNSR